MIQKISEIEQIIRTHDEFLITSHENPDGDAVGSMASMGYLLKAMGKKFSIYNASRIPDKFQWVKMPCPVDNQYFPGSHSWIIALDCGDLKRTGEKLAAEAIEPIINIDHHHGNPGFGQINWVSTHYSSAGEMVARLADRLDIRINGHLAEGIYLAMVSDTGFFSFGNTSPEVLELAAKLIRNGINPGLINAKILNQWSVERLHLHGLAMQQAIFYLNGRIGLIWVTREMLERTGASSEDCEGLVNTLRNVKSVEVAISLREEDAKRVKFSLRSTGRINVQRMAAEFDGGGHKNASGGIIYADMKNARTMIKEVVSRHLQA